MLNVKIEQYTVMLVKATVATASSPIIITA